MLSSPEANARCRAKNHLRRDPPPRMETWPTRRSTEKVICTPLLPSRVVGERERSCCRSSGCRCHVRRRWRPSAGRGRPPFAVARSGFSKWCVDKSVPVGRAMARRVAALRRCCSARGGHRRGAIFAAYWKKVLRSFATQRRSDHSGSCRA